MASREPVRLNSVSRSACALITAALLSVPIAGSAATLSQVRIGTHEDHTRIVLELDEATSYRLTPPSPGNDQLQIQLDANSAARHVPSRSPLVKAVRVTPSARGATVFVDLAEAGVGVSEMILADPARIVLDLSPAGTPVATRAAPTPSPAPSPAPTAAPEPAPAPSLAAANTPAAAPTPAAAAAAEAEEPAPSLSDPIPSDVADSQPAAQDEAAADEDAETAAVAVAAAEDRPATPLADTDDQTTERDTTAGAPSAGAAAAGAAERAAAPAKQPAEVVVRKPAPATPERDAARSASAEPTWIDRLMSPIGYAAVGVVLLALVMVAVRRRRHEEDDDPLYSVMSAEDAGDVHEGEHAPELAWNQPHDDADDVEDANATTAPSFFDDEPIDRDGAQQLSLSRGAGIDVGSEMADEPEHVPGAFLREPEPAVPLPISDEHAPSFQPEPGDMAHLAAALGDRVQELERRLEQLTEARERLERQVAAQTEELRVQRAAIARTQRVVRSMTKGEDLATEPVPRAPQV